LILLYLISILYQGRNAALSLFVVTFTCIFYFLLFIPTNAQTYILKYFINIPTCFSASTPSSWSLNFVLAKGTKYYYYFFKLQFSKSSGSLYDKIYKCSHPTNIQDTPT